MKYKFKYNHSKLFNFFIYVAFFAWVAILALNCFRVFNWFELYSRNIVLEIFTIVVSIVLMILLLLIKNIRYVLSDTLAMKVGWYDLNKSKFKIEKIYKIVQSTKDDQLFVNIFIGTEPRIVLINIAPKYFDEFVELLKAKNPKILFDKAEIED